MDYISLEILMGLKMKENTFKKVGFAKTKIFEKNSWILFFFFLLNPKHHLMSLRLSARSVCFWPTKSGESIFTHLLWCQVPSHGETGAQNAIA